MWDWQILECAGIVVIVQIFVDSGDEFTYAEAGPVKTVKKGAMSLQLL